MSAPANKPSSRRERWQNVYGLKDPERLSWYRETLEISLDMIGGSGRGTDARVIDVGGGTSTLVDHLLDRGYRNLTVLDIASAALDAARARLGARAKEVVWLHEDITRWRPQDVYDVWHDRAVFHFLVEAEDRAAYVAAMERALVPGGRAIIATFAPEGPEQCSGLPVRRYAPETLAAELGPAVSLVDSWHEVHTTPAGTPQAFIYGCFTRA
jgi:SAM-dependent methyltransferase